MLRRPPCQKPCAIGGICTRCNATRFLCTIHHFVWPPFARIIASQRSCIWSIYFLKSSTCSLSHSSSIYCRTSSSVLGNRLPTRYFNSRQTFSIRFKSGEFAGHFIFHTSLRSCRAFVALAIPSAGTIRPTVIDKIGPIESIGSRLRDHTRTFYSGVRAWSASSRTPPAEGIDSID